MLTTLTSCGFHLRGYETAMTYAVGSTVLQLNSDPVSFALKYPLNRKLDAVGIQVVDDIGREINSIDERYTGTIKVDNVRFRKYELVGVLTEIRLVLSADVTYQTLDNSIGQVGSPITVTNPIVVERSYQFDEASVSVDDMQGDEVREWLYEDLSQRIVDQYVALSLPRVPPPVSTAD